MGFTNGTVRTTDRDQFKPALYQIDWSYDASKRRLRKQEPVSDHTKGLRVRRFFELEARALEDSYKVIETLLPNAATKGAAHRAEEGRYIESLLRSFLNRHLPGNLRAVSGFLLCPSTKTGISDLARVQEFEDRHSNQLDVIVYDFDSYPV
jgi:hypothetical protein